MPRGTKAARQARVNALCEWDESNHSGDLVEVYCGHTTPTRLCGFHNSRVTDYSKFPRKVTA